MGLSRTGSTTLACRRDVRPANSFPAVRAPRAKQAPLNPTSETKRARGAATAVINQTPVKQNAYDARPMIGCHSILWAIGPIHQAMADMFK